MTRNKIGDAAILALCLIGAAVSGLWGLDAAPREYSLLLVVCLVGAVLMGRKLVHT
jgi:hypothetical protein